MGRYSPAVSPILARPLDFSSIGEAFDSLANQRVRNRQLDLLQRQADDTHAVNASALADKNAEREQWSHPAPLTDVADASKSILGAPQNGPASIGDAMRDAPPSMAAPAPAAAPSVAPLSMQGQSAGALSRINATLGLSGDSGAAAVPSPPGGTGAPALAAQVDQTKTQPGAPPDDLLSTLRRGMPKFAAPDETGMLRVYDPAQRALNQSAPALLHQRLTEMYQEQKAETALQRKAEPFLSLTDPQTGKPYTPQAARAMASNPQFASANLRETNDARAPRTFMIDGKPVEGFSDKRGVFYDASGKVLTGKITPYVKPEKDPDHFVFPTALGPDGKPMVFRGNTHSGTLEPTGVAGANKSSQMSVEQTRFLDKQVKSIMAGEPGANGRMAKPLPYYQAMTVAQQRWGARSGGAGGGKAPATAAPAADDFTTAELAAAHHGGARTDEAIRAYIAKQRGATPGGGHDDE